MRLQVTNRFKRAYKRLSPQQIKQTDKAIQLLMAAPQSKSLRFRALEGSDSYWIASVNRGDRLILGRLEHDLFELLDIGEHDATYRKWNRIK